jgi:hypothetical protein
MYLNRVWKRGEGDWRCGNRIVYILEPFKQSFHLVKYLSSEN